MELAKIVSVGIYNTDIAVRRGTHTRKRTTAMFELELPMECGGVSYIDSEESPIRPDMLICSKPGQTRYTKLPFKCYYIHIIIYNNIYFHIIQMVFPDYKVYYVAFVFHFPFLTEITSYVRVFYV